MAETESTSAPHSGDDQRQDAEAVVNQMLRFFRMTKRASAKWSAQQKDGIEQAAYFLLAVLVTEGPQRTTALAETVHADTSTVSRQVGALVRHGMVERQADPADGRACLLAATPAGQARFDQQHRARTDHMANILRNWTSDDLRAAAALLERLTKDFETYDLKHDAPNTGATAPLLAKGGTR
ncbi:MAG TPA: MarR family transcriptional regulator [Pseudonocardiaceae bacterium]|jgi:DNA-binding MarR family transcriptional regulator|nr:MarR family transcriptional regulator [Pseudonocardiaceae bacterium]